MAENTTGQFDSGADDLGSRLDIFLGAKIPWLSRTSAAKLIESGKCLVNDRVRKPSYKLKIGDKVRVKRVDTEPAEPEQQLSPRPVPFRIIYEDTFIIVIDKPPGLVVHPAPGHTEDTLVNGLLFHCPEVGQVGVAARPGIVHRLDRDTSGLMVIAKTARAHQVLSDLFKNRKVRKKYLALVHGRVQRPRGRIDLPIGRHPKDRKKMTVTAPRSRSALTLWKVKRLYEQASLLELDLKTGRTHQIRVHCRSMGHPVVGDTVYGFRLKKTGSKEKRPWQKVRRQLLHSWQLGFVHPVDGRAMIFRTPVPSDFRCILRNLFLAAHLKR